MLKEQLERRPLLVPVMVGDEPDKTALKQLVRY